MSKKKSIFLFTHCSLSHYVSLTIFSYPLYFSPLFYLLSLTQFFKIALSSLSLAGTSPLFSTPNAQMAFPFYFFHLFFSFFPSTLFTSNHNKCKQLNFDFASTKISFSSSHWPNGLCLFLFFFLQRVQHTLAHFSLREARLLTSNGVTCSLNKLLKQQRAGPMV